MRVAVLGDINLDVAVGIDRLPGPGEEVFATTARLGLGGSAANTAVVLSRLGLAATILARVGVDPFGRFAVTELEALNVDTALVQESGGDSTGMNLLLVTGDGERSMVGIRGANAAYDGGDDWVGRYAWLHLSGYALLADPQRGAARSALAAAREAGLPVSVDVPAGVGTTLGPGALEDLAGSRLISGGMAPLAAVAGSERPVETLLAHGVELVAVTAGAGTCRLWDRNGSATVTPPQVAVMDSTGAGDSFVAGLIAADLAGLASGPALVVAVALGAAATMVSGGGTALGAGGREVLAGPGWTDIEPGWIEEAARFLASPQPGTTPRTAQARAVSRMEPSSAEGRDQRSRSRSSARPESESEST